MYNCKRSLTISIAVILIGAVFAAFPAMAQQITGTPGSPDATMTISGKQLPAPDPKFGGVIKNSALQSKPWWPPRVTWGSRKGRL